MSGLDVKEIGALKFEPTKGEAIASSFFMQNKWDLDGENLDSRRQEVTISLDETLKRIGGGRESVQVQLADLLSKKIERNNRLLDLVWVNRHGRDHTDYVAANTLNLAEQMNAAVPVEKQFTEEELYYAGTAGRWHDHYLFSPDFEADVESGAISILKQDDRDSVFDFGKKHQDHHPRTGARAFDYIMQHLAEEGSEETRAALEDMTDSQRALMHEVILYHSNGSDYPESNPHLLARMIRMMDKLHMRDRVHENHVCINRRLVRGESADAVAHMIQHGEDLSDSDHEVSLHPVSFEEAIDRIKAIDPFPVHRLAPHAITDQSFDFNPKTGALTIHYYVDVSRIESDIGMQYSNQNFMVQFEDAYAESSMARAAEVAYHIREHVTGNSQAPDTDMLDVVFHFADETIETRSYKPRFD